MKVGIMGGTFDPIHKGHLMLGECAKELFALDEVWFIPNGNPPHKKRSSIGTDAEHRVKMVEAAISGIDGFRVERYEVDRTEVNYSYLTMEHFNKTYPEHAFYFIIGADSLFSMERWVKPERFLKTCTILAAFRDDKNLEEMEKQIQYLNEKYEADIHLMNSPKVAISSSEIRERLRKHERIDELVPEAVLLYIQENQLFKGDEDEGL